MVSAVLHKASFQSLRDDWGANVVRIVMYPHEYNGYCTVSESQQASYRASLLQAIKDAYDLGMYAILDWHVLNERDPNVYKTQALSFFKEMSQPLLDMAMYSNESAMSQTAQHGHPLNHTQSM